MTYNVLMGTLNPNPTHSLTHQFVVGLGQCAVLSHLKPACPRYDCTILTLGALQSILNKLLCFTHLFRAHARPATHLGGTSVRE